MLLFICLLYSTIYEIEGLKLAQYSPDKQVFIQSLYAHSHNTQNVFFLQ
jgi:hypothetical protein